MASVNVLASTESGSWRPLEPMPAAAPGGKPGPMRLTISLDVREDGYATQPRGYLSADARRHLGSPKHALIEVDAENMLLRLRAVEEPVEGSLRMVGGDGGTTNSTLLRRLVPPDTSKATIELEAVGPFLVGVIPEGVTVEQLTRPASVGDDANTGD